MMQAANVYVYLSVCLSICRASSAITYFDPYLFTARAAVEVAKAVKCGDLSGICAAVATAAKMSALGAFIPLELAVDSYKFINSVTGSAGASIASANIKVLLGTFLVGRGAGTALV